jgi:hypothetical protein
VISLGRFVAIGNAGMSYLLFVKLGCSPHNKSCTVYEMNCAA